jgi:predicted transcriptional regulator
MQARAYSFHIQWKSDLELQGKMMTKLTRINIDPNQKLPKLRHQVNYLLLDATTDEDIAKHKAQDDAEALADATRLQALQAAIQLGLDDVEAGRIKEFQSKSALRKHLKSVIAKADTIKKT